MPAHHVTHVGGIDVRVSYGFANFITMRPKKLLVLNNTIVNTTKLSNQVWSWVQYNNYSTIVAILSYMYLQGLTLLWSVFSGNRVVQFSSADLSV